MEGIPTGIVGNAGLLGLAGGQFLSERRRPRELGLRWIRSLLQSRGQSCIAGFQRIYFILVWFNSEAIDLHHGCFVLYCV